MTFDLKSRIKAFSQLQDYISIEINDLKDVVRRAKHANPWFTEETIWTSLEAIKINFLKEEKILNWLDKYNLKNDSNGVVGLILAGNIPLVGWHDVQSVLLSGHSCQLKLSSKDNILIPYLLNKLIEIEPRFRKRINVVERLEGYNAVIATGSDSSGDVFMQYFSRLPHIIRRNRNSVGVLFKDTPEQEIKKLGKDIFTYFGLGCRNVTKVFIEEGFNLDKLFEALVEYGDIINHHKYKNNFDYSNAMLLLNRQPFLTNNFLILRESEDLASRISVLNYENFSSESDLIIKLQKHTEQIQCIVSEKKLESFNVLPLGEAQSPELWDYADGVDTMAFLISL